MICASFLRLPTVSVDSRGGLTAYCYCCLVRGRRYNPVSTEYILEGRGAGSLCYSTAMICPSHELSRPHQSIADRSPLHLIDSLSVGLISRAICSGAGSLTMHVFICFPSPPFPPLHLPIAFIPGVGSSTLPRWCKYVSIGPTGAFLGLGI